MHMADALISPAVGGAMWLATGGLIGWCCRRVRALRDDRLPPLMGVLGAFVFTAQMINFSIPGTGSSGHLGGALLLAILLGPHAAFLVIASVLAVQALCFADGGLLALGCNIWNLGFFPAFVAYPCLYRPLAGGRLAGGRAFAAALAAAVAGLQCGALGVVLETACSGIASLPFGKFLLLMQPIHLAIGVVEGVATAAMVEFLARARPEALLTRAGEAGGSRRALRPVFLGLLAAAALLGGAVSWFASVKPDGLEWAVSRVAGRAEPARPADRAHAVAAQAQEAMAAMPDYRFQGDPERQPRLASSVSGLLGGGAVLALALLAGFLLRASRGGGPHAS